MIMNCDDRIKELAAKEGARVSEGFDGRIDQLTDGLCTQKKRTRHKFRGMQIAAIIAAVCLFAGGTVYAAANGFISFGWDGKQQVTDVPKETGVTVSTVEIGGSESVDYDAIVADLASNEVFRVVDADGNGGSSSRVINIDSLEELKDILAGSVIPYQIPSILPEGYSFSKAYIQYGLSPDLIDPNTTPSRTEELANGKVLEVFSLPDGYEKYIDSYAIDFVNTKGDILSCTAMPMEKDSKIGFGASETGTAKKVEIPGFSEAVFINDESGKLAYQQMIYAKKDIDAVPYMGVFTLDYGNTTAGKAGAPFVTDYYDAIIYNAQGNGVEEQSLIDLLKNIN